MFKKQHINSKTVVMGQQNLLKQSTLKFLASRTKNF